MTISIVQVERKRAAQTVAWLLDKIANLLDREEAAFNDYVKAKGDYPPNGWNIASRTDQYHLQCEIDDHIGHAISLDERDGYIMLKCLMPWEAFEAKQKFMAEVQQYRKQ